MNKKEIIKKLKELKMKMKLTKKDDYEEYLRIRDERLKLEQELAEMKQTYYKNEAEAAKVKLRRGQDHKKFIYGGLVVKYFGFINPEELEKKFQSIVNHSDVKNNKNNDDDISEYLKSVEC